MGLSDSERVAPSAAVLFYTALSHDEVASSGKLYPRGIDAATDPHGSRRMKTDRSTTVDTYGAMPGEAARPNSMAAN